LSIEELFTLLQDASSFGVKEINLGGMNGEPFCKKGIIELVRRIKRLGFVGSMTTNGSFLNSRLAGEFDDCGWDIMLLSLDSPREGLQHLLRPSSSGQPYSQDNRISGASQSRKSGLRILINMVITKLNYKLLPEMLEFADRYRNIESVNICGLWIWAYPRIMNLTSQETSLKEFQSILLSLKDRKKMSYIDSWAAQPHVRENDARSCSARAGLSLPAKKCFTNYYILSIDSNGDILQCPQYQKRVGGLNIRKVPLSSLWGNELFRFRSSLAEQAPCYDECCTILKEQNRLIYDSLKQQGLVPACPEVKCSRIFR
jgi:MoaA/NifB/PqqE/SkfB family radical SAM enzyme